MKCPYQTKVIHKPEDTEGYVKHFAEDITEFGECVKSECPFYYTTEYKPARHVTEHCRKIDEWREEMDNAIKRALEKQRWIPVSERLPEDGTYLVTIKSTTGIGINIRNFAKDLNKVDEFDFPNHKCGWYDYDGEWGYWEDTNVIAWMPLPEPYKAESEG